MIEFILGLGFILFFLVSIFLVFYVRFLLRIKNSIFAILRDRQQKINESVEILGFMDSDVKKVCETFLPLPEKERFLETYCGDMERIKANLKILEKVPHSLVEYLEDDGEKKA